MHLHAERRPQQEPDDLEFEQLRNAPLALGRFSRFFNSTDKETKLKGLLLLHEKFYHRPADRIETLLMRAGVGMPLELIKEAVARCRPCSLWAPPRAAPRNTTRRAGEEGEADYMFWEGHPIFTIIDRFQRFHKGRITVDRAALRVTQLGLLSSPQPSTAPKSKGGRGPPNGQHPFLLSG